MSKCPVPEQTPRRIEIGVGELGVARAPDLLITMALGSCVGVALWDPFTLNGGLAHVMLPRVTDSVCNGPASRFAGNAIPMLVEALDEMGSPRRRLLAKIAGGSAMFKDELSGSDVGARNVAEVRTQLERLRVPIRGEDLGGRHARTVELHLDSGTLIVRSYVFGIREL